MAKAIRQHMPDIDMLYYGDTLHVPYGGKSQAAIYGYTEQAIKEMFERDCQLVIIACNTANAAALRRIQQEYLPENYPDRRVLGVIVPTLETAIERGHKKFGLLATKYITESNIYGDELVKINPDIELAFQAAPLLVPMIEHGGMKWIKPVLQDYIDPLVDAGIDCLILGCTHYPYLKKIVREILPDYIDILSQDEIIPAKLEDYLRRHKEINRLISRKGRAEFYVSDLTDSYDESATLIYKDRIDIKHLSQSM